MLKGIVPPPPFLKINPFYYPPSNPPCQTGARLEGLACLLSLGGVIHAAGYDSVSLECSGNMAKYNVWV